ncbi:hypothetical protein X874_15780 [Mannheimia varigena USDA-ARS-USMARC-1312]|nr:hypothetical protein X874_15780 [Mannheimia varigena USDA-ARS-USMARC-1312]AHG79045.1 hypothetical protein X875_4240 [Mannheimia varigena USDA-ARS-USMARC-1388]
MSCHNSPVTSVKAKHIGWLEKQQAVKFAKNFANHTAYR